MYKVSSEFISLDEYPDSFEAVAGTAEIRSILPSKLGQSKLRLHIVGRMPSEDSDTGYWCGLYKVQPEDGKDHFGILRGCENSELFAQAAIAGGFLEFGCWERVMAVGLTDQHVQAIKPPKPEKSEKAKTAAMAVGTVVAILIENLYVNSRSKTGSGSRRVTIRAEGKLIANGLVVAEGYIVGEGTIKAKKWSNPFLAADTLDAG